MDIDLYMLNWIKNQGKGKSTPSGDYNTKLDTEGITRISTNFGIKELIKKINANNLDLSNLTTLDYLFQGCLNLEEIEGIITSDSTTSFILTFGGCSKLTSVNLTNVNTKNCTSFMSCFTGCSSLVDINFGNNFSFESVTGNTQLNNMFTGCRNLSDTTLNSFLKVLLSATSYTGTKTLSTLGMVYAVANKCATLSNWADCQTAGWSTGY